MQIDKTSTEPNEVFYFEQSVHTNCLGRKNSCWLDEWEGSSSSSAIYLTSRAEWERGSGRVCNESVFERKSKDYSRRCIQQYFCTQLNKNI